MRVFILLLFMTFLVSTDIFFCDEITEILSEHCFNEKRTSIEIDKKTYKNGDKLYFSFKAYKTGYFTCFQFNSNGESEIICPSQFDSRNFIFKNQKLFFPEDYEMILNSDVSGECFLLVISGINDLDSLHSVVGSINSKKLEILSNLLNSKVIDICEYDYNYIPNSNKYLISIGVGEYKNLSKLDSPCEDAMQIASVFKDYYFLPPENITTLMDSQANKRSITKTIESLTGKLNENDELIIYFSGHGKRVPDKNGDEPDGMDETLCPWDFDEDDESTYLIDDVICSYILRLLAKVKTLNVIFDSCYSGDAYRYNDLKKEYKIKSDDDISNNKEIEKNDFLKIKNEKFTFWGSSLESEISVDAYSDLGHSLFTYFLIRNLKRHCETLENGGIKTDLIFKDLYSEIKDFSEFNGIYFQTPVFLKEGEFENYGY